MKIHTYTFLHVLHTCTYTHTHTHAGATGFCLIGVIWILMKSKELTLPFILGKKLSFLRLLILQRWSQFLHPVRSWPRGPYVQATCRSGGVLGSRVPVQKVMLKGCFHWSGFCSTCWAGMWPRTIAGGCRCLSACLTGRPDVPQDAATSLCNTTHSIRFWPPVRIFWNLLLTGAK